MQIGLGRKRFDLREYLSVMFPQDYLHVSIDAMDNKKTNTPQSRHLSHTKKVAQTGELLKTRVMGELLKGGEGVLSFMGTIISCRSRSRPC